MHPSSTQKNSISPSWRPLTCAPCLLVVDRMVVPSVGRTQETAPKHPSGYQGCSRCSHPRFSDQKYPVPMYDRGSQILKRSNNHPKNPPVLSWNLAVLWGFWSNRNWWELFDSDFSKYPKAVVSFPSFRRKTQSQCWFDLSNTLPSACCCQCWAGIEISFRIRTGIFPVLFPKTSAANISN